MSERVNAAVKIKIQLDRNAKKYQKKKSELEGDLSRLRSGMDFNERNDYNKRIQETH